MNFELTKQDLENWAGFARNIRINVRKIKELQENINFFSSVDYQKEISNKTPSDMVGNIVVNYLSWQEALLQELEENLEKILIIEEKIAKIEDANVKIVLRLHYREGWGWQRIANEFGSKESTVRMACKKFCF